MGFGHRPFGHHPFGHDYATLPTAVLAPGRHPGYLVEVNTLVRPRNWTSAGNVLIDSTSVLIDSTSVLLSAGGLWTCYLGRDVQTVDSVNENGIALSSVTSAAAVISTASSWYYDGQAATLWIRTRDGLPAPDKVELVAVPELMEYGTGPGIYTRGDVTRPAVYEGRLMALPSFSLAAGEEPEQTGGAALGAVRILTNDGRWQRILASRTVQGQTVTIYRGDLWGSGDDYTGNRDALQRWAVASAAEPSLSYPRDTGGGGDAPVVCEIQLQANLQSPVCPLRFDTDTYPNMDPRIADLNIPVVYGSVLKATAYRIASGRWKVSSRSCVSIDAVYLSNGGVVSVALVDSGLGEFEVNSSYDTEETLFVDCTGFAPLGGSTPSIYAGRMMREFALQAGIPIARIDGVGLDALDLERPIALGYQASTGSIQEACTAIATSVFADVYLDRGNRLSARARRVDGGNVLADPEFRTVGTGSSAWLTSAATVAPLTSPRPEGVAGAAQVVKAAADRLANVYTTAATISGQRYRATVLAAILAGDTVQFRMAVSDVAGTLLTSDDIALEAGRWKRVTWDLIGAENTLGAVDIGSVVVTIDSTAIKLDQGTALFRIYPAYNGANAVTLGLTAAELTPVVLLDDSNARLEGCRLEPLVISRLGYRYATDLQSKAGPFASYDDPMAATLHPLAEKRQVESFIVDASNAQTIADIAGPYYSRERLTLNIAVLDWETALTIGDVVDVSALLGVPALPDHSMLARVTSVAEAPPSGGQGAPEIRISAVLHYEPIGVPQMF